MGGMKERKENIHSVIPGVRHLLKEGQMSSIITKGISVLKGEAGKALHYHS